MLKIGKNKITKESKLFIIAEIGVNHDCSISKAKKMILKAKQGGANVAKFQTYKAEKLASKVSPSYWDNKKEKKKNQFELFKQYDHFDKKDYKLLSDYCKKVGIEFCSTPFDEDAVDFINPFVYFFKIASADINNFFLIKKICEKKKPIILSTGASSIKEIKEAITFIKKNKIPPEKVIIMHCILNYPTKDENANLNMIIDLKRVFPKHIIGYSDHTLPDNYMSSISAAYTMGAVVIEKHFTYDKKKKGNDHYHSMDYEDLKKIRLITNIIKSKLGHKKKFFINTEKIARLNARRSLFLNRDMEKNARIKKEDLICLRPGSGIPPNNFKKVIGKKTKKNLKKGKILAYSDFY